jgi:hypothetical protein
MTERLLHRAGLQQFHIKGASIGRKSGPIAFYSQR